MRFILFEVADSNQYIVRPVNKKTKENGAKNMPFQKEK